MREVLGAINQEEVDTQVNRFLTFHLGKEVFGIEIRYVTEIIGMQEISDLPETPDYMKGIINLRGKIIPVIDIRLRFKQEAAAYTDRTCIIIIDMAGMLVGLIVDRVEEVTTIPEDSIVPPPDVHTGIQSRFIKGIGKLGEDIRLLLDCERLFHFEETIY